MIRYLRNSRARVECAPVAMVNALKFQKRPAAKRGLKLLKYFKNKMKYDGRGGGVDDHNVTPVYENFGFRRLEKPSWRKIARSLFAGNAAIITIRYASRRAMREGILCTWLAGHVFMIDGVVVCDGEVRYHAINDARHHRQGVPLGEPLWLTAEEIMKTYHVLDPPTIDYVYIVPPTANKEAA